MAGSSLMGFVIFMQKTKLGCVYFFKHVGIPLVKIGFTNQPTPQDRFKHFNAFAPYGALCIGYIQSDNAYLLEQSLHEKFKDYRTRLEWFALSEEECKLIIKSYKGFLIGSTGKAVSFDMMSPKKLTSQDIFDVLKLCSNNKTKAAKQLGMSRKNLYKYIKIAS